MNKDIKHTQGKWRVEENGAGVTYIRSSQRNGLGNEMYIATMHETLDGKNNATFIEEAKVNARLIASAPRMYAILKSVLIMLEPKEGFESYKGTIEEVLAEVDKY